MTAFSIKFVIVFINTILMIYFINKDYKLNWKAKKVFTYSRYSKIASIIGFANIGITTGLLDFVHEKFLKIYFNSSINFVIEWFIIPLICILIFFSIFYSTYSQYAFKKENNIKDKESVCENE